MGVNNTKKVRYTRLATGEWEGRQRLRERKRKGRKEAKERGMG